MVVIVREGELTEDKKQSCYEYSGLFKIINRVSKLIETMEEIDKYVAYSDKQYVRKTAVKEINKILDYIDEELEYAKVMAEKAKPFWQTGEITNVFNKYNYKEKKRLKELSPEERKREIQNEIEYKKLIRKAFKK